MSRIRTFGFCAIIAATVALVGLAAGASTVAAASQPFTVEMLQTVKGSGKGFTTAPLVAVVGDTMEYHIIVRNTGSNQLEFKGLTDEHCDPGTIAGGPGTTTVRPGGSTKWLCKRRVTAADQEAGVLENSATATGNRPIEPDRPQSETSNTVVVKVPPGIVAPKFTASATCSSLTLNFTGFAEWSGNTIKEVVHVDSVLAYEASFTFDGSSGSNTTPLAFSSGAHTISAHAAWNTNGVKGGATHAVKITCP